MDGKGHFLDNIFSRFSCDTVMPLILVFTV